MIVNVICAAVETLVQMHICFSIYIKTYGKNNKFNKIHKIITAVLIIIVYLFLTLNNIMYLFSISAIVTELPIITILLWFFIRDEFISILAWCFFNITTIVLLKLPILIIIGLIYNESLCDMDLIKNSHPWSRLINCAIFISLFIVCIRKKEFISKLLKNMAHQKTIFLFIGGVEFIITYYIMCLGWYGFTVHTLILTLSLIFMLFAFIICMVALIEYQMMVKVNRLLKSKESNIKINYALINQEIERNRKINHDKKYDLEYLYYCFEQKDYENGLNYIRQKEEYYNLIQKNLIWTGYGSIDFLINRAKARADEKKISFTIKVDIVEIPIEEYDFFSVLSNLLDNAIEAAMQNDVGEGRIMLQILSLNNVFRLRIENTYLVEPKKKGKRFISANSDKELHGWGLENVKEIVNKYDGEIDIKYGNGIFLVTIILLNNRR